MVVAAVSAWSQRLLCRDTPETSSAPAVCIPVVTADGGPAGTMVRLAVAIGRGPVVARALLAVVLGDGPALVVAVLAVGGDGREPPDWPPDTTWSHPRR